MALSVAPTTPAAERAQLLVRGAAWLEHAHALRETPRFELTHEGGVSIRSEGMTVAEAIAGQALADDDRHFAHPDSLTQRRAAARPDRQQIASGGLPR